MYPANVQIFLSQFPLGKKTVMMASSELTANSAQPPEHSTALVCKYDTIQTLSVVHCIIFASLACSMATLHYYYYFQGFCGLSPDQLDDCLVWDIQPAQQLKLKVAENIIIIIIF